MVPTLVIVNGEDFWHEHFADDYEVYHVRLQTSKWMLTDGTLFVYDGNKQIRVDAIFWRIGAIQPYQHHREILELIRFSGVPCVNSPTVMLDDFNRWSMLNRLKELKIPIVPFTAVVGSLLANQMKLEIPSVIKVGSYHAGYGKMRITSLEQWQDMTDFVFATDGYFTIEPFINYKRDIRCLAIGNQIWTLARQGSRWKANTGIVETHLISAPDILYDYTKRVVEILDADIIALDILETQDNEYFVLESNSVPGISGFPNAVVEAIVERVNQKITKT
jgi:ribosomal protein S6--L-glutamate ligase